MILFNAASALTLETIDSSDSGTHDSHCRYGITEALTLAHSQRLNRWLLARVKAPQVCFKQTCKLQAFHNLKNNLANRLTLAHFDPAGDRFVSLSTDASADGWAGTFTSVPKVLPLVEEELPPQDEDHLPIAFKGSSYY